MIADKLVHHGFIHNEVLRAWAEKFTGYNPILTPGKVQVMMALKGICTILLFIMFLNQHLQFKNEIASRP